MICCLQLVLKRNLSKEDTNVYRIKEFKFSQEIFFYFFYEKVVIYLAEISKKGTIMLITIKIMVLMGIQIIVII